MKDVIFSYTDEKYYGATPQNFTIKLIELLRDRYVENTNVWKIVIRDVGSAYARAFEGFNRIVDIRNLEIRARRQMIANILGVFAGAGLCWISPTLHQWKRIDHILTTEGAKTFFSDGFQEVVKQSGTFLTRALTEVSFQKCLPDLSRMLVSPLEFQNTLMNAFESCRNQVTMQLTDTIETLKPRDPQTKASVLGILDDQGFDWRDASLSRTDLFVKIDSIFFESKQLAKKMNEHCIDASIYFREKPVFDQSPRFIDIMAIRFERAMWAAWIPHALKRKKRLQVLVSRTFKPSQPWDSKFFQDSFLQNLKPGYYYMENPDYVMRIYEVFEKPGSTLEDRLEYLKVIKSKKNAACNPGAGDGHQLENFGFLTTKGEIIRLIAWAENEDQRPYGWDETRFKERDRSELMIRPLAG